jgi:hypothetical protein
VDDPVAALLNAAVFVLLGYGGHRAGHRVGLGPRACFLLVILGGLAVSLTLEAGQYVVANRHGLRWSFLTRHGSDVALHAAGTVAGALVAWVSASGRTGRGRDPRRPA